jgi:hypothetical protein
VTKDRKDFFGAATSLGQVAAVAEKLLGSKLAVQPEEANLRRLAMPEAAQIFEIVRARIMASASFEKQPDGIAGLEVLVRAQPSLQTNLLDLLESLPSSRLGGWVCAGWNNALKDPAAVNRLNQLLEVWSNGGSPILKTTAANVLRTRPQGGR